MMHQLSLPLLRLFPLLRLLSPSASCAPLPLRFFKNGYFS